MTKKVKHHWSLQGFLDWYKVQSDNQNNLRQKYWMQQLTHCTFPIMDRFVSTILKTLLSITYSAQNIKASETCLFEWNIWGLTAKEWFNLTCDTKGGTRPTLVQFQPKNIHSVLLQLLTVVDDVGYWLLLWFLATTCRETSKRRVQSERSHMLVIMFVCVSACTSPNPDQ